MNYTFPKHFPIALACLCFSNSGFASLSITLNFDDNAAAYSSLHNDSWDASTSNSVKKAAFENVIRAAANRWEHAFAGSTEDLSLNVNVSWFSYGGTTLAKGGSSWPGTPDYPILNSSLKWDNDGSSDFYVDLSPYDTNEWDKHTNRSMDFGGGDINVERVSYEANSTAARNNTDLYSVALHELGHTLGVLGGNNAYPKYADLYSDGDLDLDLSDGSQIPITSDKYHTNIKIGHPSFSFFKYGPNALAPYVITGIRQDLTEADIRVIADVHGFDNVNYLPIPEPSATGLLAIAGLGFIPFSPFPGSHPHYSTRLLTSPLATLVVITSPSPTAAASVTIFPSASIVMEKPRAKADSGPSVRCGPVPPPAANAPARAPQPFSPPAQTAPRHGQASQPGAQ